MKYPVLLFIVCVSAVCVRQCAGKTLDCTEVCSSVHLHDDSLTVHCGCHVPHGNTHHHEKTTEVPDIKASTLSLCDYLCSIQQGGAACDCSVSIVPGK